MPKNLIKNLRPRRISLGLKNLSVKKPSAKGAGLRSSNKNLKPARPRLRLGEAGETRSLKQMSAQKSKFQNLPPTAGSRCGGTNFKSNLKLKIQKLFGIGALDLNRHWSFGFGISARRIKLAIVVAGIIAIGGITTLVFLPEQARSKTFTFLQTARSSAAVLVVVLTAYFGHAIIKLINPPRAYFCRCGVLFCSI